MLESIIIYRVLEFLLCMFNMCDEVVIPGVKGAVYCC
jgi:hypothetical protein